jgi:hypothetical protein
VEIDIPISMVRGRATLRPWHIVRPAGVVRQLDDPFLPQLRHAHCLTFVVEDPDLQATAALSKRRRHLRNLDVCTRRQLAGKPHREIRLAKTPGRQGALPECGSWQRHIASALTTQPIELIAVVLYELGSIRELQAAT